MITTNIARLRQALIAVPLAALAVAGAIGASAASGAAASPGYGDPPTTQPPAPTTAAPVAPTAAPETSAPSVGTGEDDTLPVGGTSVGVADSVVGPILVDGNGMTLYIFTKDVDGEPTCEGECAANWPAAVIDGEPDVGDLDASLFSTVDSPDGGTMLKVGNWPLYTFAGDTAPGDTNGQGVGGVWWVVTPSGKPIAHASVVETELGQVIVDGQGMTLYGFTNDTEGEPTCVDDCAVNWPPALVKLGASAAGSSVPETSAAEATAPQLFVGDLDPALFSVVEHPDGPMLKIGDWPLYRFAGDSEPGDVNGQAVGDVWWVVAPDGTLIRG